MAAIVAHNGGPMRDDRSLGVYLHVPFCGQRCAYCDFAIVTGQDRRVPEFSDALAAEIAAFAVRFGTRPADTVYFGGGTPSRVPPAVVARALGAVREAFRLDPEGEVSLEANPEDVQPETLAAWRAAGVNRLTIGIQSLTGDGLAALGRPGSAADSTRAVGAARAGGIPSLGIDLIFGWPGQSLAGWAGELAQAIELGPDHVSIYALETTSRTPLVRAIERGALARPDPDLMAEMYEAAVAALEAAGLARYEISNFSSAGHESRHNLRYWRDLPYAGFGPSAASYVDGMRWTNPRRFSDYEAAARAGFPPVEAEPFDPDRRAGEALVFGLRTAQGVDLAPLAARYGEPAIAARGAALERAVRSGLARRDGTRVRLTGPGFLIADELFVDLL
jgi:oxygen-independent coproporphyrinogen-3 oxidase